MGNKSFQDEFVKNDKNIVIPLLQRDYVQGDIKRDIINEFLEKLISALEKENGTEDLNYIYGYEKNGCFVPIDGQQRLITLWLLHLYIYAKDSKEFPVELKFESREFADSFCEKLRKELPQILAEKVADLKEIIIDKQWFISGWLYDATVNNMLNTLNLINQKLDGKNNLHTENISFDFLDMKDRLDDDVYVKMNGRGRPLSYFENLKSWMDERCSDEYWKVSMDNKWTDLFWENRNRGQEHPEEIDDEQMRFFYSMLLLYWKINENNFLKSSKITTDKFTQYNYISFLNEWERETNQISEDIADEDIIEEIQDKTFSLLLKGEKMIPLYWIEETKMFNNEVFQFIKEGLDALDKIKNCINDNDSKLYKDIICVLDLVSDKNQSYLYQLAFKDASYTKTLPLLYALIKTPEKYQDREHFYQWIRLWRNLVINTYIDADNIGKVCKTINDVSTKVGSNDNLYSVISSLKAKDFIGFDKEQVAEEIAKSVKIDADSFWELKIIEAEKYAFFDGAISFLFYNENGKVDWRDFDIKWGNAQKYFDKNGVKEEYKITLTKSLVIQCDNWESQLYNKQIFNSNDDTWYTILCSEEWHRPIHNILIVDNLNDLKCSTNLNNDYANTYVLPLLKYLPYKEFVENEPDGRFKWNMRLGYYRPYGQSSITFDGDNFQRNKILNQILNKSDFEINISNDIIEIPKNTKQSVFFFWGWDINFECMGKNFQWNNNNYVYLMKDNNPNDYVVKNNNADIETKKFYCFDASDIETTDEFWSELKKLKRTKF